MPGENPLLAALTAYLKERKHYPEVQRTGAIPGRPNVQAEFSPFVGERGRITLTDKAQGTTLPHELTHAAELAMLRHAWEGSNPQFTEAYNKLLAKGQAVDQAVHLSPDLTVDHPERFNSQELLAYGVGNQSPGVPENRIWRGGGHLDSTMATQMAILLELARRKGK